jgi:hypothetical protein
MDKMSKYSDDNTMLYLVIGLLFAIYCVVMFIVVSSANDRKLHLLKKKA